MSIDIGIRVTGTGWTFLSSPSSLPPRTAHKRRMSVRGTGATATGVKMGMTKPNYDGEAFNYYPHHHQTPWLSWTSWENVKRTWTRSVARGGHRGMALPPTGLAPPPPKKNLRQRGRRHLILSAVPPPRFVLAPTPGKILATVLTWTIFSTSQRQRIREIFLFSSIIWKWVGVSMPCNILTHLLLGASIVIFFFCVPEGETVLGAKYQCVSCGEKF